MVTRFMALCLIAVFAATTAQADKTPHSQKSSSSELSFLEAGHDYVIRFPEQSKIFKKKMSGVTSTSYTTEDGKKRPGTPATWTMTVAVDIFRVVRFGGGSWVLLEHPSSPDDFAKWNGMRRALAQLTDQRIKQLESDSKGREKLQKLREAASREIRTATTWVNLDHAIAIADVPTEPVDVKLSIQSIDVKDKK